MKKNYLSFLAVSFLAVPIATITTNNLSAKANDLLASESVNDFPNNNEELDEPTSSDEPLNDEDPDTYSASEDFPGADGNYSHVISSGNYPWTYQALNLASFYEEALVGVNPETGQLSIDENNRALQMYSTFRDTRKTVGDTTVMYPGHDETKTMPLDWMYAYPPGYKTADDDAKVGTASSQWGGVFTASQQWFTVAGGQWIHPGYNVAVATCFFAPKGGTITISDSIYMPSSGYESDGIDIAIYKTPKDYIYKGIKLWSSGDAFGLYGATPIYPEPGVNITKDFSKGWKHITPKVDNTYTTDPIDVEKDDMIVVLYGNHLTTTSDLTYTSPKITYLSKTDTISLDHFNEPISIGETLQLNATIKPASSQSKTVTWSSEDPTIASVDENGLVLGVSAGTTSIWATLESGVSAYCLIKVRNKTIG